MVPKEVHVILGHCKYAALCGQGELELQLELRWLVHCLQRGEITLGYLGGPGVITRVPGSSNQNRDSRVLTGGDPDPVLLALKMEEGSHKLRKQAASRCFKRQGEVFGY